MPLISGKEIFIMAPRKPKFEYSIICDDIREEKGNKLTLVGMYQRDIFVPKFPFSFPKLCFVLSYTGIKGGDSFSMQLITPSGKQLGPTIKGVAQQGIKRSASFVALAMFSPLVVNEAGLHKMLVTFNDTDKSRKEIGFNINSTLSKSHFQVRLPTTHRWTRCYIPH